MKITVVQNRTSPLLEQLLAVWEGSVRATHSFLSEHELQQIKKIVPQALAEVPRLIIVETDHQAPAGFMGINGQHLEMLFIAPQERGTGLGKALLEYGLANYSINDLTVNEQNPLAKGFYEYMGFVEYKRTAHDEQGQPYPLIYMQPGAKN